VPDPSECIKPEYNEKREAIKTALGLEYFFEPTNPQKKAVVPHFSFLRIRNESTGD
jgi:hypothetical protein